MVWLFVRLLLHRGEPRSRTYNGQTIKLRFRMGSDNGQTGPYRIGALTRSRFLIRAEPSVDRACRRDAFAG